MENDLSLAQPAPFMLIWMQKSCKVFVLREYEHAKEKKIGERE